MPRGVATPLVGLERLESDNPNLLNPKQVAHAMLEIAQGNSTGKAFVIKLGKNHSPKYTTLQALKGFLFKGGNNEIFKANSNRRYRGNRIFKNSGRTPMQLATECSLKACEDAGIEPSLINGISVFSAEKNTEIEVARNLGIPELTFFSMIHHGGGAPGGVIQQAAMAVDSGVADYVLVYRAFNERSWHRFGTGVQGRHQSPEAFDVSFSWSSPFGLLTPASWVAMYATRYMHQYGATSEDFGAIAVTDRKNTQQTTLPHSSTKTNNT